MDIVFGNTSEKININIEITGIIKASDIISFSKNKIVRKEEARTFEKAC